VSAALGRQPDKVKARAGLARALVALALGLCSAGAAWAHAQLLASVPADGQVLVSAPKLLQLRFNEALEPSFSRVVIAGADGKPVATGKLRLADGDTRSAVVPL
jgi:copper resistance protein C